MQYERMQSREEEIIRAIDSYCSATGLTHATVGSRVQSEPYLYDRLIKGGSCGTKVHQKIMRWFKDNAPPINGKHKATKAP